MGVVPVNGHTHMVGGLLIGAALAPVLRESGGHLIPWLAAAALAAPLPDLDHPASMYGRFLPLPGVAKVSGCLEPYVPGPFGNGGQTFGHVGRRTPFGVLWHRGPLHSILMATAFGAAAFLAASHFAPALDVTVGLGVLLGYLSHLALDELNVAGEHLLWPLVGRELGLPWPSVRVGSVGEATLFAAMSLAAAALLSPHLGFPALAVFRP